MKMPSLTWRAIRAGCYIRLPHNPRPISSCRNFSAFVSHRGTLRSSTLLITKPRCSTHTRRYSSPPRTITDPSRPDLFYHLLPPPTPASKDSPAYGVSFSPTPSIIVVGWLPAVAENEGDAGLNDFKENRKFRVDCPCRLIVLNRNSAEFRFIMHRAIQDALRKDMDDIQRNAALQLQNGWMHIHGGFYFLAPHAADPDGGAMTPKTNAISHLWAE